MDLDEDAQDELIVVIDGSLYVVYVNTISGASLVEPVAGITTPYVDTIGNHQVLVTDEGTIVASLATLHDDGASWTGTPVEIGEGIRGAQAVGDLDGDGTTDVLLLRDTTLEVFRGPLDSALPDGDRLLEMTPWDAGTSIGFRHQIAASGDVDGDGADDLVLHQLEEIVVIHGPLVAGTTGSVETLAAARFSTDEDDDGGGVGIVDDVDGNGLREVVGTIGDEVWIFEEGTAAPVQVRPGAAWRRLPESPTTVLVAGYQGAGWWYPPATDDDRPADAGAVIEAAEHALFARLGADEAVDFACTVDDVLYVVAGFGGFVGPDVDRDGFAEPEDCDDTQPDVNPTAIDVGDGVDNNCDGAVDERGTDLLAARYGEEGDKLGKSMVVWTDPAGDRAAWQFGFTSLRVAALATGELVVRDEGPDILGGFGDYDGDGTMDLVGANFHFGMRLLYGPSDDQEFGKWGAWSNLAYVDGVGDLDADGYDDVVYEPGYGDWVYDPVWGKDFYVYTYYGLVSFGRADRTGDHRDGVRFTSGTERVVVLGPSDWNADGHLDLVRDVGRDVQVFFGPFTQAEALVDRVPDLFVEEWSGAGARAVATDGAALDDIMAYSANGEVSIATGPWAAGTVDFASAVQVVYTGLKESSFGRAAVVGSGWLFVGAPSEDDARGAVYGFPLDPLLSMDAAEAPYHLVGPVAAGCFGSSLALGDYDADGTQELFVGSECTHVTEDDGAVWVYRLP